MRPTAVTVLRQSTLKGKSTVRLCPDFFTANTSYPDRFGSISEIGLRPMNPRKAFNQANLGNKSKAKETPLQFSPAAYTFWMTGSHYAWNSDPAQGDEGVWKTVNDVDVKFK